MNRNPETPLPSSLTEKINTATKKAKANWRLRTFTGASLVFIVACAPEQPSTSQYVDLPIGTQFKNDYEKAAKAAKIATENPSKSRNLIESIDNPDIQDYATHASDTATMKSAMQLAQHNQYSKAEERIAGMTYRDIRDQAEAVVDTVEARNAMCSLLTVDPHKTKASPLVLLKQADFEKVNKIREHIEDPKLQKRTGIVSEVMKLKLKGYKRDEMKELDRKVKDECKSLTAEALSKWTAVSEATQTEWKVLDQHSKQKSGQLEPTLKSPFLVKPADYHIAADAAEAAAVTFNFKKPNELIQTIKDPEIQDQASYAVDAQIGELAAHTAVNDKSYKLAEDYVEEIESPTIYSLAEDAVDLKEAAAALSYARQGESQNATAVGRLVESPAIKNWMNRGLSIRQSDEAAQIQLKLEKKAQGALEELKKISTNRRDELIARADK